MSLSLSLVMMHEGRCILTATLSFRLTGKAVKPARGMIKLKRLSGLGVHQAIAESSMSFRFADGLAGVRMA